MRGIQMNSLWRRGAAASGLGALLVTVGCGGALNGAGANAQQLSAAQPGTPVVVSCEPHQRTLVRPALVNGVAMSQVECVSADQTGTYAPQQQVAQPFAAPVRYRAARAIESVRDPELADARVIPASYPVAAPRPVRTNQVVYGDDRVEPVKRDRSVKKSAVIIGSSAGVGAAVGAAVKGKKGAIIGAAIGGGGAAVWDQITRRKN
jgi:hypothetical protein